MKTALPFMLKSLRVITVSLKYQSFPGQDLVFLSCCCLCQKHLVKMELHDAALIFNFSFIYLIFIFQL